MPACRKPRVEAVPPQSYAGQCVLNYTITATSSDGSVVPDITGGL